MKTHELFGETCRMAGLGIEEIQLLRAKRTGASIINSSVRSGNAPSRTTLYESAVIVTKD